MQKDLTEDQNCRICWDTVSVMLSVTLLLLYGERTVSEGRDALPCHTGWCVTIRVIGEVCGYWHMLLSASLAHL
jgi:hypothetical protein